MDRQFSGRRSTSSLLLDDDNNIEDQSPSFHHLTQKQQRSLSCTHFPLDASPLNPQNPESLWTRTSFTSSSHPSLLYCCISSLRHDGDVYSIAVSGEVVLTGSNSRRVHAWQSGDCHALGYLQASSGEVRAMVAQGNMLFTSHKDHKIRIWSMRSHTCNHNTNSNNFKPRKVTTLPITNHFKNFVLRPTVQQNRLTSKPITPQHKDIISCMAYYQIEGILYTGSFDKTVKAWKLNERKCIDSFIAHSDNINDMVINQQNGYLFTCSSDGTVKMWLRVYGETSHALIKVLSFHSYPIYALALSNQNRTSSSFLYSGSFDGCINFWEQEISCQYNQGNRFLQGHQFAVLCLVAIENFVISGSEDATIRIWRRSLEENKTGCVHECLAVLEGHRGPVRCLTAFSQRDRFAVSFLVFSASLDQTFKVWRVKIIQEMKDSSSNNEEGDSMERRNSVDIGKSPVLSPSWVKKKLQSRSVNSV